jgi:hypothetical protein
MFIKGYSISGSGQDPVMDSCEHGSDIQVLLQTVNCFSWSAKQLLLEAPCTMEASKHCQKSVFRSCSLIICCRLRPSIYCFVVFHCFQCLALFTFHGLFSAVFTDFFSLCLHFLRYYCFHARVNIYFKHIPTLKVKLKCELRQVWSMFIYLLFNKHWSHLTELPLQFYFQFK